MDEPTNDLGPDFHLNADAQARLRAASDQFFRTRGYRPPPNNIDLGDAVALIDPPEMQSSTVAPVSPFELARIREVVGVIVGNVQAVDPLSLDFNPFVGEVEGTVAPVLHNIKAVLHGEAFVTNVATESQLVRGRVRSLAADIDAAKKILEVREAERIAMEIAARENFEYAKRCLQETGPIDRDDVLSPKNALPIRYESDRVAAANIVEMLQVGGSLKLLNDAVAAFGENWGDRFDAVHVSYASSTVRRRRRRRVRRGVIRLALAATVATVTLLLDQAVGSAWAFTGSAIFAALAFVADPYVDRSLDIHARRSQIRDLIDAIRRSEELFEELVHRESQFNGIRALRGLPSVVLVDRTLLSPPVN